MALARAFASEPSLLLADEPTGNLDGETGAQVIRLMFDLRRQPGRHAGPDHPRPGSGRPLRPRDPAG